MRLAKCRCPLERTCRRPGAPGSFDAMIRLAMIDSISERMADEIGWTLRGTY